MSFVEFGLHPELVQAVQRMGFEQPTPIQQMAIPPALQGRDVLAAAMTGSGKTAAFLLPILHHLAPKTRGITRALVVAPTRELAAQIAEHLRDLAGQTGITGAAIYGGVAMRPQEQAFRKGVDVIVATPGRLLDHLQYSYAKLKTIEYLVLDEADRMLDMGFLPDVRRILGFVPKARRTYLFSATLPEAIVALADDFLTDPVALNIERKSAPAVGITHTAYPVPHELKSHLLLALLGQGSARSVLAFTRTKHRADRLADFLERRGVAAARIHGNRSQAQRTEALAGFKAGRYRVMVATDIAARGIDVEALELVVNFDVPPVPEDYIHRVGRTARIHATGDAYTLVSRDEEHDLHAIESHMGKRLPRQLVAGFDYEKRPAEKLEVPLHERIAAIRARKREERGRAQANAERRNARAIPSAPPAGGRSGGYSPRGSQESRGSRGPGVSRMGAGLAWLREVQAEKERGGLASSGMRRSFGR
jgi:ATP-dependent RNA helicase RhlE